jgi:CO/xanthine dehydrogenase Mo-binding subunit
VDCRTGRVEPLRIVSVHDVGRVVDRRRAAGQVHGGVVQGLGMALLERLCFDDGGAVVDGSLFAQTIPPADWGPVVEPLFVEDPHPGSPLGAKGLGESPVMGVVPAIANAIYAATGARLREVPFTPERVLAALPERRQARRRPPAEVA